MVRIIICGACGRMGGNVLDLLKEDKDAVAVCGVDLYPREIGIPVYTNFAAIQEEADVIIDFSSPTGLKERLDYAKEKGLGMVLAATGFSRPADRPFARADERRAKRAGYGSIRRPSGRCAGGNYGH